FSIDYPYQRIEDRAQFIETAPINDGDKAKICYHNAEQLLNLGVNQHMTITPLVGCAILVQSLNSVSKQSGRRRKHLWSGNRARLPRQQKGEESPSLGPA